MSPRFELERLVADVYAEPFFVWYQYLVIESQVVVFKSGCLARAISAGGHLVSTARPQSWHIT
ncbi:MAG: hypothetical protein O2856_16915 [Planctomycetota bacterium]|nr:hypothetical protein [Planctomycetota bacterium]